MHKKLARILIAAPASGSGKTTVVCAILRAFVRRGLPTAAFKCGPDYIDPMFHRACTGVRTSGNLDLFLNSEDSMRALLVQRAGDSKLVIAEGAMGYYDGVAGGLGASAYAVACAAEMPVVLLVDCRGMSASVAAQIKGFMQFRADSHIQAVILNRLSPMLYPEMKEMIERECGARVAGFMPSMPDCALESRHLGLVTAQEIENLSDRLDRLAEQAERTIDLALLTKLANEAPPLMYDFAPSGRQSLRSKMRGILCLRSKRATVTRQRMADKVRQPADRRGLSRPAKAVRKYTLPTLPVATTIRLAVARDAAFCFYYEETLALLESLGAQLCFFSPLVDSVLPENCDGLLLGGGYPELYAAQLAGNSPMLESVYAAINAGMPTIAECGGFLYLHRSLEDTKGNSFPMAGVIDADAVKGDKLGRFGYVELHAKQESLLCGAGECLRAHTFHYWRSENEGEAFTAHKAGRNIQWDTAYATDSLYAGFAHLYLAGDTAAAMRYVQAAAVFGERRIER